MPEINNSVFDILQERGFIAQVTDETAVRKILSSSAVTFYIGYDPTADSLHVGHFLQAMAMAHMQHAGHRPIAIIGGGTAMVGDPSGKTDMRRMLSREEIIHNGEKLKQQLSRLIDFSNDKALMVDNADWLLKLNYVDFLRDIGVYFSVNRMLTAECFKARMEKGLSFIEFNYMLMQSFDFLMLFQKYGCILQLGGDDQWSNILYGIDLIRRVEGKEAFGLTFNLLTTSDGRKMGKTESGAVWLDPQKTSPYDFYQYWRNIQDDDVIKCLKLLTFLPMQKISELEALKENQVNEVKKVLAFEVSSIVHGAEEAFKAQRTAEAIFETGGDISGMPSVEIARGKFEQGLSAVETAVISGIAASNSEARRLITQGGLYISGRRVEQFYETVNINDFINGSLIVKKGQKTFKRILLK